MWPILLDMTKEESMRHLRSLEIDAFSSLVNALRAQGTLDSEKLKLLKETGSLLNISQERHKAEIRRVINDEKLTTIAYHINGEKHSMDEWIEEGQRIIPLMARMAPQTAYAAIADEVADCALKINKQLPMPASTDRKRPPVMSPTQSNASTSDMSNKNLQFRLSQEQDMKKRKVAVNLDGALAQHLMAPPKISKIQQIYRQKTKNRQKEQMVKRKSQEVELDRSDYVVQHVSMSPAISKSNQVVQLPKVQPKVTINQLPTTNNGSSCNQKVNILQNISIPIPPALVAVSSQVPNLFEEVVTSDISSKDTQLCAIQNNLPKSDAAKIKSSANPLWKPLPSKTVTTNAGQKVIVVSTSLNSNSLTPTTSILQRTLTTIPFKNISMKSLDKFKIVSTPGAAQLSNVQGSRQKVVTVRTNSANKKIIPFSQVQVLNTKGGIKVLPIGGKLITKAGAAGKAFTLTTSSSAIVDHTKSTSCTPLIMSSKRQDEDVEELSMEMDNKCCDESVESSANDIRDESLDNDQIKVENECADEKDVGSMDDIRVADPVVVNCVGNQITLDEEALKLENEISALHENSLVDGNNHVEKDDCQEHLSADVDNQSLINEEYVEVKMNVDDTSYYLIEGEESAIEEVMVNVPEKPHSEEALAIKISNNSSDEIVLNSRKSNGNNLEDGVEEPQSNATVDESELIDVTLNESVQCDTPLGEDTTNLV